MKTSNDLRQLLHNIDHRSYPAYKDTKGVYQFNQYELSIDHVQGDPFASPSDLSILVSPRAAAFPPRLYDTYEKKVALQDYLLRGFGREAERYSHAARGSGKSGVIAVSRCGQEVLDRTSCQIDKNGGIVLRLEVGFPANGRTINSGELIKILFDFLPECVQRTLFYTKYDERKKRETEALRALAEDQTELRRQLPLLDLAAFVANGSVLPRESGASPRPMKGGVPFSSPKSMEVTIDLPNHGPITGMGIKKGVTLIVGGGYHGKSTLLKALELGVYNHIRGDGREYIVTDDTAYKSRAEDGRSIQNVDISMFINHLPNGKDTVRFVTEDASGSTSQAGGVSEGVEAGVGLLLIDEDTSATNFMIRDELMQRVVNRDHEPIIPFIERVRELYDRFGVSTILVAGSSGAYFHVADKVIQMDRYKPEDITELAKREAESFPAITMQNLPPMEFRGIRVPLPSGKFKDSRLKIKSMGKDSVVVDREPIDLRYVEQLVDGEQMNALGKILQYAQLNLIDGRKNLSQVVDSIQKMIETQGLFAVCGRRAALPRRQELFACFNRYRSMEFK